MRVLTGRASFGEDDCEIAGVASLKLYSITILAQNLLSPPHDGSFNRQDANLFIVEDKSIGARRPLVAKAFDDLTQTINQTDSFTTRVRPQVAIANRDVRCDGEGESLPGW